MNHFYTDGDDEIKVVLEWAKSQGIPAAFTDTVLKGGPGGVELAKVVLEETEKPSDFHYLYDLNLPVDEKIRTIAMNMYKVSDIELSSGARSNLRKIKKLLLKYHRILGAFSFPLILHNQAGFFHFCLQSLILPLP